jgi:hypothetical protein
VSRGTPPSSRSPPDDPERSATAAPAPGADGRAPDAREAGAAVAARTRSPSGRAGIAPEPIVDVTATSPADVGRPDSSPELAEALRLPEPDLEPSDDHRSDDSRRPTIALSSRNGESAATTCIGVL